MVMQLMLFMHDIPSNSSSEITTNVVHTEKNHAKFIPQQETHTYTIHTYS